MKITNNDFYQQINYLPMDLVHRWITSASCNLYTWTIQELKIEASWQIFRALESSTAIKQKKSTVSRNTEIIEFSTSQWFICSEDSRPRLRNLIHVDPERDRVFWVWKLMMIRMWCLKCVKSSLNEVGI